jgi:hypothetical protein
MVRVLFAIDACDREVVGWLATSAGISGEMVRDLMVACVERRFGISKTAHPVEFCASVFSATSDLFGQTGCTPPRFVDELRKEGYPVLTIDRDYGVSMMQVARSGRAPSGIKGD